ncbi:hypothetical protein LMH87_010416 [Akanthomyces muscarius]|uniref:Thioredoxin domain-containing protein n=1 Tax=Akanthomyces muscarius TaxID=2231603 RepID=A0A9W8QG09_AKAMU|nr:hypothetical protein LMH87_010416 [Akanthomyces muscarius]KAJ4153951.1 hypothetical protein LMH87_010416 [Akanthomyces muscarius]
MGATQHIDDQVEWDHVLEKTQVVVVDFYADWCGPCKMIGPHFERLADEYAKPKKMAFVKVNTEKGSIGQMYGVRSLPTFKVLHKGIVVETVTGANPAALAGAIVKASKLVQGGGSAEVFGNRGQTLGGSGSSGSALSNINFDPISIVHHIITIIGLYLVSFLSSDAYRSAKNSSFNIENKKSDTRVVVRNAKQRFRDTLPKGYLNEEEYRLYERLYGPPLRETTPEDVGIPEHADMGRANPDSEGVLLRELDGGEFEEVNYELAKQSVEDGESVDNFVFAKEPGYIDIVARSDRERIALEQLQEDFESAARAQEESADELEEPDEADDRNGTEGETSWATGDYPTSQPTSYGEARRFHPYTLEGRFHDNPVEILLPQERLVKPLQSLLGRTHLDHVKAAAESAFGGRGLPTSPVTPFGLRNGHMGGIGLPPDSRHMTEIEADAFLAAYVPGAYASAMSTLREVRKRIGGDWIQSRLKNNGPGLSVLDAGAGGAGLVAWEQIVQAEWDLLAEKGEVEGDKVPGKKTVVVGSDRLRGRLKTFLDNTTFLPRLPDYMHSGAMKSGQHLDSGGSEPQKRKSYDIIIASHLFLKEKQDHYRQAVLNNLWTLLNPDGGVLIVMEKAHPRGFEAVAHVRDTLLKQFLLPQSGENPMNAENFNPAYQRELEAGRILAPCTNHGTCPMYPEPGKSKGRKDYCHFSQRFVRPAFYSKLLGKEAHNQGEVEFSYVAVQKGVQTGEEQESKKLTEEAFAGYEKAEEQPDMQTLPRIVLPPIKRKGHVTLDTCTPDGRLERWTVPKSFSKVAYHDARKSRWGDLWALGAKTRVPRSARAGTGVDTDKQRAIEAKKAQREAAREGLGTDWQVKSRLGRGNSRTRRQEDLIRQIMEEQHDDDKEIDREVDEELAEMDREAEDERRSRR